MRSKYATSVLCSPPSSSLFLRHVSVLTSDLDGVLDLGGLVGGDLADVVAGVVLVGQGDDQGVAVRLLGQLKRLAFVRRDSSVAKASD